MGFSLENKELNDLIKFIKEYNEEQIRIKDRIHCILYFLNENKFSRILSEVVKEFFKYIYQKRIKVIFVINFNNGRKHVCKNKLKKTSDLYLILTNIIFFSNEMMQI